ncbi:MAG TPA: HAMP domain-containing sensor histidine kinase [Candidatus Dormibacteraeota bacterium]|nr:HAMP domain-containing sensor histidine kinase [Candidatus Dormibacteraeota bacterium]
MSLRLRLALFGVGLVALALLIFGVLLYALLARGVNSNQDDALRARAQQVVASLNAAPVLTPGGALAPEDLRTSTEVFVEVFVGGSAIYSTAEPLVTPDLAHAGFTTQDGFRLFVAPFNRGFVVTGQSVKVPQSNLSGVVVFLVISGIAGLIAGLIASWVVAGRALAPLKKVAATADEIGRTRDFARRLPTHRSRDEVAVLAASFNGMLMRLQDAFEAQRRFVSDASHELRTPLTTIQGNAGLLASRDLTEETRRAAVADVIQESGRMARLVDRMLTLARADAGLELARVPRDLKPIVDEVCRQASALHERTKLELDTGASRVRGDEDALRQLVWILLDNAFRYARTQVVVRLTAESGWARLTVADDGPGVPAEAREKIFERFYRVEGSRTGPHSGLGLSIARWIVAQHEGRILAVEAALGGAAFLVDIPLLRAS